MDSEEKQPAERTLPMSIEDEPMSLQADVEQPMRSASPSTISTVSSASPLVRRFSDASSSTGSASSSTLSSSSTRSGRVRPAPTSIAAAQLQCQMGLDDVHARQLDRQQQQQLQQAQPTKSKLRGQQQASKSDSAAKATRKAQQAEPNKSFGYNLAKSVAYRAYGFNGFWSTSGVRYINLLCLLTTLVCLATILLLSNGNSSTGVSNKADQQPRLSKLARTVDGRDEAVESIETLDSQALVSRPGADRPTGNGPDDQPDDEFDVTSLPPSTTPSKPTLAEPKWRSKAPTDKERTNRPGEREGELGERTSAHRAPAGWSPFDPPLFSQLMADLDLPEPQQLFAKSPPRASANSATFSWSKPAIKRSENGATIILSTSGSFSSNVNNLTGAGQSADSPLSALLERLLPSASSVGPSPFAPFDPFGYPRRAPMFAPFGTMQQAHFLAPPVAFASPSSLMGVVMRAAQAAAEAADSNSTSTLNAGNKPALVQLASQSSNQTTSGGQPGANGTQLHPQDSMEMPVRVRPSSAGTMLIMSSSVVPSQNPFEPSSGFMPFGPFANPPSVHLMEMPGVAGSGSFGDHFGSSAPSMPLGNLLRGLLLSGAHERPTKLPNGDHESSMGPLEPEESSRSAASSEWDDSRTVHSLRARHRSDSPDEQLDPIVDTNDLFGVADMEQHQRPQLAGRTLRQTIRGPGVTVERIIELPAGRQVYGGHTHRNPLAGLRSQSLSRADFGATDGNDQHGSISNERPMIPPAGFIGRLLADMSGRSEMALGNRARARSLQIERLDESDESQEVNDEPTNPPVPSSGVFLGPKVRVASARIRMRPNDFFMLPSHFNTADSEETIMGKPAGSPAHSRFNSASSSLDDTLNSMEDRLNQALETSSDPAQQHDANSDAKQVGTIAVASLARGGPTPKAVVSNDNDSSDREAQDSQQQQQEQRDIQNPFTSPSSPLFGFPVSSAAIVGPESAQQGSNRQPRGFTYHSNNELASPFAQHKPEVSEQQQVDIIARSNMGAPVPPAAMAMGRRLDDGPSFGSDAGQVETSKGST